MAARRQGAAGAGAPSKAGARRNAIRRSQAITTWGPGAMLELPMDSVMVAGLDDWGAFAREERIIEPRLSRKIKAFLDLDVEPELYAPPRPDEQAYDRARQVTAWRFPEWFIVQEKARDGLPALSLSRRLVHRTALDRGRFDKLPVVAIRFVQACRRGHIDDINWRTYAHRDEVTCHQQMWLEERGTTGDLVDLTVRCDCGESRRLIDAADPALAALRTCNGRRPWLGNAAPLEACPEPARLLNRQATNGYFGKVLSVLAMPDRSAELGDALRPHLGTLLTFVPSIEFMKVARGNGAIAQALRNFSDPEVFEELERLRGGGPVQALVPVKFAELDALLAAPEGYDDTIPIDTNFHARRLPDTAWRPSRAGTAAGLIERVVQVHRLREVLALLGFTRFEATPVEADGDYSTEMQAAKLARNAQWFPAIENRGEGIFVQLRKEAIDAWLARPAVQARLTALEGGHKAWVNARPWASPTFRGGPYLMLHTLAHLLCQELAVRSGYPSSAIRERVYADNEAGRYGVLLYTGTADAGGTLGGLVQEAFGIVGHLDGALDAAAICSNDPICAAHRPEDPLEERFLHGAACHGCVLIGETSCEAHNDHLDRALVVPVLGLAEAAFFRGAP